MITPAMRAESFGVRTLPHDMHPRENLALQTSIVAGASAFVGTYGGFSYLAPFLGVRSTAYFSDAGGYSARHLLMARSALESIGGRRMPGCVAYGLQQLR
jgi:hypothetical protein